MKVDVPSAIGEDAGATLRRASRELRNAVGMVEDLEEFVGLNFGVAGEAGPDPMLELQKLDHLQQKILGIADFLDALSKNMPADWRVDAHGASRCVLLSELGASLGSPQAPAPSQPAAGSYEIF